jgi:hypothetical protein
MNSDGGPYQCSS